MISSAHKRIFTATAALLLCAGCGTTRVSDSGLAVVASPAAQEADKPAADADKKSLTVPSLAWLAGEWRTPAEKAKSGSMCETFSSPHAGIIMGTSYMERGGKVVNTEFIQIYANASGQAVYKAMPAGQKPTDFPLVSNSNGLAVFLNPDHDFPSRIEYERKANSLEIRLQGSGDAAKQKMAFTLELIHGAAMPSTSTPTKTPETKEEDKEMSNPIVYKDGATAALSVTDLKKAIAWYTDILGFKHMYTVDEMAWAELSTGLAGFNIGLGQREKVQTGGGAVVTFGVADLDATRKWLESKNVKFEGPTHTIPGMVKLATFYDLDGNSLMLFQSLMDHSGVPAGK